MQSDGSDGFSLWKNKTWEMARAHLVSTDVFLSLTSNMGGWVQESRNKIYTNRTRMRFLFPWSTDRLSSQYTDPVALVSQNPTSRAATQPGFRSFRAEKGLSPGQVRTISHLAEQKTWLGYGPWGLGLHIPAVALLSLRWCALSG